MAKGWYGNKQAHSLASKGIKVKTDFLFAKGSVLANDGSRGVTKNEKFNFCFARYDIYKAGQFIEENPREPIHVPVDSAVAMIGDTFGKVSVDEEYAKTLTKEDCERAGIGIMLDEGGMVIDGWHRILACHNHGIEVFPIYILTKEEAWEIGNRQARQTLPKPEGRRRPAR